MMHNRNSFIKQTQIKCTRYTKTICREWADGYWEVCEYDFRGNRLSLLNSDGYWEDVEYNENNDMIYYEDSEQGIMMDHIEDDLDDFIEME